MYEQYALGNEMGYGGNKWYNNMLETKYDAVKYAMENIFAGACNNIVAIVTKTGWSSQSASNSFSSVSNAKDYIGNILKSMNDHDASSILYKKIYFLNYLMRIRKHIWCTTVYCYYFFQVYHMEHIVSDHNNLYEYNNNDIYEYDDDERMQKG